MKMLKIILITCIGLLLLSAISIAVDYYFYSWTSFVRPFGCEYKSVREIYQQEKLEQEYDLIEIKKIIKSNPNYRIELPYDNELDNDNTLRVSRMFGNVKYNIGIWKHTRSDDKYTKIGFSNLNFDYQNPVLPQGEKPTAPNYYIKNNIYQMIDEMPLTDAQKNELKSKVQISCSPTTRFTF